LAAGFIPSGLTKVFDEGFTSLAVNHPMGNYLESLYHTGYYYPFIGYLQVLAAVLLLIPRTATLGAIIYFPIILNICILSLSVEFDGSLISSPLMVYANFYLLCWDYDKLKYVLPFSKKDPAPSIAGIKLGNDKFPKAFFGGVILTIALTVLVLANAYEKRTRNTYGECISDCDGHENPEACVRFCECIHKEGNSFDSCTDELKSAMKRR
jgi:uncharacterized membrane protein YphA (DoxX/SURF4 family)